MPPGAHSAAPLAGVGPKTVRRYVDARDEGRPVGPSVRRPRLIDLFLAKVEELVETSEGAVRSEALPHLRADTSCKHWRTFEILGAVMSDQRAEGMTWDVIVPGKRLFESKTRLSCEIAGAGPTLARSMMEDVLGALREAGSVDRIIVVTSDPVLSALACDYGGAVVADPDAGLNVAFAAGLEMTRLEAARVAYFVADLPCLTGKTVEQVLAQAGTTAHAVVPDEGMQGTTILTTMRRAGIHPQFGSASLQRHVAVGAVPVALDLARARRDVDTLADLAAARGLGLGPQCAKAADNLLSASWRGGL
jgi:2-phospho-L-lactate guanylyltransferase